MTRFILAFGEGLRGEKARSGIGFRKFAGERKQAFPAQVVRVTGNLVRPFQNTQRGSEKMVAVGFGDLAGG